MIRQANFLPRAPRPARADLAPLPPEASEPPTTEIDIAIAPGLFWRVSVAEIVNQLGNNLGELDEADLIRIEGLAQRAREMM